jgi:hypothetical protein
MACMLESLLPELKSERRRRGWRARLPMRMRPKRKTFDCMLQKWCALALQANSFMNQKNIAVERVVLHITCTAAENNHASCPNPYSCPISS